jgi:hypothetical protein
LEPLVLAELVHDIVNVPLKKETLFEYSELSLKHASILKNNYFEIIISIIQKV